MPTLASEWIEEGKQIGLMEGIERGMERGIERGRERGREEGREEGIYEGIEKGIEKEKKELVYRMFKKGMSLDSISDITELSKSEIEEIIKSVES